MCVCVCVCVADGTVTMHLFFASTKRIKCHAFCQDLEMDVPGLSEGKEYLFRVKACNDEGESEPLEADTAIVAKDPYGKNYGYTTSNYSV